MTRRLRHVGEALHAAGQGHLLRFVHELDEARRQAFLMRLETLDLPRLAGLIRAVLAPPAERGSVRVEPPELIEHGTGAEHAARDRTARERGDGALAAGEVAAFLVAGGQGTRLGFDGPKGRFPIGPLTGRSLFAWHAQRVLAASRRYGRPLPLLVMTSEANDRSTREAFVEAEDFGLDPSQVRFVVQGQLPAIDPEGRILLADKDQLAMSPDGHGGLFAALRTGDGLSWLAEQGARHLFTVQVDNPLAPVFDPVFIGHHLQAGADMSTKVVAKTDPGEKVGVVALLDGRTGVIEYSDLDPELAAAREPDGRLRFRAGNIAVHLIALTFAERVAQGTLALPVHRADKQVACLDEQGRLAQPATPNAIKMETFVFDALAFAQRSVTQEVRREDEFAPVKNASGPDSAETARALIAGQGKRWMTAAGLALPAGSVEVGPLFALDQEEFLANLTRGDFGPVFDRS